MSDRGGHGSDRPETGTDLTARRTHIAVTCGYTNPMGDGGAVVHSLAHTRVTNRRPSPNLSRSGRKASAA